MWIVDIFNHSEVTQNTSHNDQRYHLCTVVSAAMQILPIFLFLAVY